MDDFPPVLVKIVCGAVTHLQSQYLAPKHFDTRFVKISVDNAPFLVTKLKVQVLPCVIAFVDGQGDKFTTKDLETRLLGAGVLLRAKTGDERGLRLDPSKQRSQQVKDDEENYDEDEEWG